jgi:hypothetical protein
MMTYQRPLPLSAAFPPSAPPGAPPPEAGPPGAATPFAGLLRDQSPARTAPAEGDKKKGPQATPAASAEGSPAPGEGEPTAAGEAAVAAAVAPAA